MYIVINSLGIQTKKNLQVGKKSAKEMPASTENF